MTLDLSVMHRSAAPRLAAALALSAALPACVAAEGGTGPRERLGEAAHAVTVAEAADASCSTTAVKGLSEQIVEQANCISPGAFVQVPALANLSLGAAVFPYLEEPARDALVAALESAPGTTMSVTSMLRTVAQQYLLHRWYLNGECGIGLAATPGGSNHETGLALDVSNYTAWRPTWRTTGSRGSGAGTRSISITRGPARSITAARTCSRSSSSGT